MPKQHIIGKDCRLFFDTPDNWETPDLTEIVEAVDVSMPGISKNAVDLPSRGSAGWSLKGAGLKSLDLSFGYLYHTDGDAILDDLLESFTDDTPLVFYVLDGDGDGQSDRDVQGFRFVGVVFDAPMTEELEDGRRFEFSAQAIRFKDDGDLLLPEWYTVEKLTPPG